jgi:hypothetical protein
VLEAAEFSQPLFSSAPLANREPFEIHFVVRPFPNPPGPLPDNLFDRIQYSGYGGWLALNLGNWGHCHIDLDKGRAWAVLGPELGFRPEAVSRYLLNTILTNFMIAEGLAMIHATAVYRNGRVLLMMADHNNGKSTTALHLTLAGYAFVSDSQIYVEKKDDAIHLYGFPVGRVKLRQDMLASFPRLATHLKSEPVRREMKFRLDLGLIDPHFVQDGVIRPEKVVLCLLSRGNRPATTWSPAAHSEALESAMVNSLFYDRPTGWKQNFERIEQLVNRADCFHLDLGTEVEGIISAVNELMA